MNNIAKSTIGLMIATMLCKVLGFGRELVLGASYGTSAYSDAYITAMNIPIVLFTLVASAFGTTFIPIYYEINNKHGKEEALKFTNNIGNIIIIVSTILAILGFIFAEPLVKLFAIGFKGEIFRITVIFTRIMTFGVIFIGITNLLTSYLQIKNDFTTPGLIGLPLNIIIIISIILSAKISPIILPIGTLVGMASQVIFQLPFAMKRGYSYSLYLNIKDKYIKKILYLIGPVFIGVAVNQVNAMVDRTLASTLIEGSISALNYANKLNTFIMGLFIATIASVIYPTLSNLSSSDNKNKFIDSVSKSINSVVLLVLPISVGAIILAAPIVKLLFERGAFNTQATQMTAIALVFYSLGMLASGLREIIGKTFFAIQDTKTPMINGAVTMLFNIVLNIILVKFMGHAGLAFATSIAGTIGIIHLFINLKKKIGYFGQDKILKVMIKSLVASLIMGVVTSIVYNNIYNITGVSFIGQAISLFVSVSIGVIIYLVIISMLKIDEIELIKGYVKDKLKRR